MLVKTNTSNCGYLYYRVHFLYSVISTAGGGMLDQLTRDLFLNHQTGETHMNTSQVSWRHDGFRAERVL